MGQSARSNSTGVSAFRSLQQIQSICPTIAVGWELPIGDRLLLAVVSHSPPGQDQPRESNFRPSGRNSPFGETCRYNVCRVTPSSPHRPPTTVFGVRGATEQKVYLSPVPACRPAFCLGSSIKPPFYETVTASTKEANNTPKSGAINSFC